MTGRLGSTLRAAKYLSSVSVTGLAMFKDAELKPCPCGGPVQAPNMSGKITLDEIAGRMLPKDSPDLAELQAGFAALDRVVGLRNQVLESCKCPTFRPKVHAELAVLETVHKANIDFYEDDKYIACSKGACSAVTVTSCITEEGLPNRLVTTISG